MLCRKTRSGVEVSLVLENRFPKLCDIVGREVQSVKGVDQIKERLKCFRLIHHCKSDKEAHAVESIAAVAI